MKPDSHLAGDKPEVDSSSRGASACERPVRTEEHEMTMANIREWLALRLETKSPDLLVSKRHLAEVARWIGKYDDPPQKLIKEMKRCLEVFLEEWETIEGKCNHPPREQGLYCPACHATELLS